MPTTTDTPGLYPVALNGVGFNLDDSDGNPGVVHQSIRTQREQSVGEGAIGESSVNPEGFWRRSRDGWHHGAGQTYGDRDTSDPLRFHESHGVDVFSTKHQMTLLNATESVGYTAASDPIFTLQAGSYIYLRDVNAIKFTATPLTTPWSLTTVTGTSTGAATAVRTMATDGAYVYVAFGSNGIYRTTIGGASASSFVTGDVNAVWFVKGRLIAGYGASIYNPTSAGALPSALLTLGSGTWTDVCGGPNHIYMLTSTGAIYKTSIKPDGTALDVPTIAGELQTISASSRTGLGIYSHAGKVFVATSTGVRMAEIDTNGNLVFGSEIPVPVTTAYAAFLGVSQFVYFSYGKDTGSVTDGSGLGRMDLTYETQPTTPAYARDIWASTADDVSSIINYRGTLFFTGASQVYKQASTYLTTGYVTSGLLALDLADLKTPVSIDVEAATPSTTTVVEAVSVDRGANFTTVGTRNTANTDDELTITGVAAARAFEIKTTLTGPGASTPTMYRHTLKVEPGVSQGLYIIARLRLFESELGFGGQRTSRASVATARASIEALQASREVVVWQEGSTNYNVTVRDLEWQSVMHAEAPADGELQGVMQVRMKVVSDA